MHSSECHVSDHNNSVYTCDVHSSECHVSDHNNSVYTCDVHSSEWSSSSTSTFSATHASAKAVHVEVNVREPLTSYSMNVHVSHSPDYVISLGDHWMALIRGSSEDSYVW